MTSACTLVEEMFESRFKLEPTWSHHVDGNSGSVRFGIEGRQYEGYYCEFQEQWYVSLFDSLGTPAKGNKRAGSARVFHERYFKKDEAYLALLVLFDFISRQHEIVGEKVAEVTEQAMLARLHV